MPEPELFLLFVRPLNRAGIRYIVSGSVAAIFYGEPRLTHDVDLVVFLSDADIRRLVEAFPAAEFYLPPVETMVAEAGQAQRRLPACWGHPQAHAGALLLGVRLVERQPTVAVDFRRRPVPIPAALRSGAWTSALPPFRHAFPVWKLEATLRLVGGLLVACWWLPCAEGITVPFWDSGARFQPVQAPNLINCVYRPASACDPPSACRRA